MRGLKNSTLNTEVETALGIVKSEVDGCEYRFMSFAKWRSRAGDARYFEHVDSVEGIKEALLKFEGMDKFPNLEKLANAIKSLSFVYANGDADTAKVYRIWLMDSITLIWHELGEAYNDGTGKPVTVCMELEGASNGARRLAGMLTKVLSRFDIEVVETDMLEKDQMESMLSACRPASKRNCREEQMGSEGPRGLAVKKQSQRPKVGGWKDMTHALTGRYLPPRLKNEQTGLLYRGADSGSSTTWRLDLKTNNVLNGTFLELLQDFKTAQGSVAVLGEFCKSCGMTCLAGGYLKDNYESQLSSMRRMLRDWGCTIYDMSERSSFKGRSCELDGVGDTYQEMIGRLKTMIADVEFAKYMNPKVVECRRLFQLDLLNFVMGASQLRWDIDGLRTLIQLWTMWSEWLFDTIERKDAVVIFCGAREKPRFYGWLWMVSRMHIPVFVLDPAKSKFKDFEGVSGMVVQEYPNVLEIENMDLDKEVVVTTTDAAMRDRLISREVKDYLGVWTPISPQDIKVIRLETAWSELAPHWQAPARARTGFSLSDTELTVPAMFVKIIGSPAETEGKFWKWLSEFENDKMIVLNDFPGIIDNDRGRYKDTCRAQLMQDNEIREEFGYLHTKIFERVCDALAKIQNSGYRDDVPFIDSVLCAAKRLVGSTKASVRLIEFMKSQLSCIDFCGDLPKVVVINSQLAACTVLDAMWLQFLSAIGFDVMVISPQGARDIESIATAIQQFYRTERLDVGKFKIRTPLSAGDKKVGLVQRMKDAFTGYINGWEDE